MNEEQIAAWLADVSGDKSITEDDVTITNGRVDFKYGLSIGMCDLSTIPFKFGKINGDFDLDDVKVDSLDFLPMEVAGVMSFMKIHDKNGALPLWEFRRILLIKLRSVATSHEQVDRILKYDRVDGGMPSELIPSKMNQLKAMCR